jgi:signal transduction histidine kinase
VRTAVVRVGVDLAGELAPEQLDDGMARLRELVRCAGVELVENDLANLPPKRREVELLIAGDDPDELTRAAIELCANAFDTTPVPGVVTFISRGTDDDAHGVLAGLGLTAEIERVPGDDGWDVVHVTLRKADLERVPESRVHTALEASLNCEVRIRTV